MTRHARFHDSQHSGFLTSGISSLKLFMKLETFFLDSSFILFGLRLHFVFDIAHCWNIQTSSQRTSHMHSFKVLKTFRPILNSHQLGRGESTLAWPFILHTWKATQHICNTAHTQHVLIKIIKVESHRKCSLLYTIHAITNYLPDCQRDDKKHSSSKVSAYCSM